jgi:hypothetical protein
VIDDLPPAAHLADSAPVIDARSVVQVDSQKGVKGIHHLLPRDSRTVGESAYAGADDAFCVGHRQHRDPHEAGGT